MLITQLLGCIVLLLSIISGCVYPLFPQAEVGVTEQSAKRRIAETDLFDFVWVGDPQISPDGTRVVFYRVRPNKERSGYDGTMWIVDTDGRSEPVEILTGNVNTARWSPDGKWLAYRRDGQIALYSIITKASRTLTDVKTGTGTPIWSPDGRKIAFSSSIPDQPDAKAPDTSGHRSDVRVITDAAFHSSGRGYLDNSRHQHLFIIDVDTETSDQKSAPVQLTSGSLDDNEPVWSPDGSRIYYVTAPPAEQFTHRDLFYVDVSDRRSTQFASIPVGGFHFAISPDGNRLAFHGAVVTEPIRSYSQFDLWVIDIKQGAKPRNLTVDYDFDMNNTVTGDNNAAIRTAQTLHWSPDGRFIFDLSSRRGRTMLVRVDISSNKVEDITKGDQAVIDFSQTPDARRFVVTVSDPVMNADLFVVTPDGSQRRITDVNKEVWSNLALTQPEEITYKSFDGREIQGWIQKPPDFDPRKKYPLVVQVHGGPHGAFGWTFNFEFQLLAARGYVVLYVNPRGSWGYGQEFGNSIQYDHPISDSRDILAGVDDIEKRGYIDPNRIGIAGGSSGGMVVDWIVGHDTRFAAAVASRDISNWETWWYDTNYPWFTPVWFKKPPFEDPKAYADRSPITYVEKIRTPMMFVEGEEDHLAPSYSGGEQLFRALKYLRRPAVMIMFPREGHGLSFAGEPWHRVESLQHTLNWFDTWLMGVPHPEYGDLSVAK